MGVVGLFLAELDTGIFLSATNEILSRFESILFSRAQLFFAKEFPFSVKLAMS